MNPTFRLSRIRAPRGTATAILLLTVFFVVVGLVMYGASPTIATGPRYFDSNALTFINWLFGWGK